MKYFVLLAKYPADIVERRAPFREDHLAYAQKLADEGRIEFGGAFQDPIDTGVIVYRANSKEEVEQMIADDPYGVAGLFDEREIREWNVVVGRHLSKGK